MEDLAENFNALMAEVVRLKPSSSKGKYVKSVSSFLNDGSWDQGCVCVKLTVIWPASLTRSERGLVAL